MLSNVAKYTNDYGKSFDETFHPTNVDELYKFIGCQIFMGLFQAKREKLDDMWSKEFGRPFVKNAFSRNRFRQIKRFLRTDDHQKRINSHQRARLLPISELWANFIKNCQKMYVPKMDITIDEMMIPFRGRCSFKMYLPSKPCKYGIKIFACVETESKYFFNGSIYGGKIGLNPEKNQAFNVVCNLMDPLLNKGYNLCTDNFYTSFQLAHFLIKKKTTLVGTVRKNKAEIPVIFNSSKNRDPGDFLYGYQKDLTLLSYVPKKNKHVLLLSTLHTSHQSIINDLPEMISDYNRLKVGVDVLDQILGYYSCRRGTRRWPFTVWMHIVDLAAHNAYVIYSKVLPSEYKSKRQFLIDLAKDLVPIQETDQIQKDVAKVPKVSSRSRCQVCPYKNDRKTKIVCHSCKKFICSDHQVQLCENCYLK